MSYLQMLDYEQASAETKAAYDAQFKKNGRVTNMKKTLLSSMPAYETFMHMYKLRDNIVSLIGERGVFMFSYAISSSDACIICSLFFRKILTELGDDPDDPKLTVKEQAAMDLGQAMGANPHEVPEYVYEELKKLFTDEQIIQLITYGCVMVATNLFNTVAQVPLDEVLYPFREGEAKKKAAEKKNS